MNGKVKNLVDYHYEKSHSEVILKPKDLYDYRKKGYGIIKNDNSWVVSKPARVTATILVECELECKDVITLLYDRRISEGLTDEFFANVQLGTIKLEVKDDKLVVVESPF